MNALSWMFEGVGGWGGGLVGGGWWVVGGVRGSGLLCCTVQRSDHKIIKRKNGK